MPIQDEMLKQARAISETNRVSNCFPIPYMKNIATISAITIMNKEYPSNCTFLTSSLLIYVTLLLSDIF